MPKIIKGFETIEGIAQYDYESLANIPSLVKTINGSRPDEEGNINIKIESDENIEIDLEGYATKDDIKNMVICDLEGATEDESIIPGSASKVNPIAKTEDMTQPVGMDTEGKLWVAPIGGSGGFNITSDNEGNVIIVSSGTVKITDDGEGNIIIE